MPFKVPLRVALVLALVLAAVLAAIIFLVFGAEQGAWQLYKAQAATALRHVYEHRKPYVKSAVTTCHWLRTAFLRGLFVLARVAYTFYRLARHPSTTRIKQTIVSVADRGRDTARTAEHALQTISTVTSLLRTLLATLCGQKAATAILVGLAIAILIFLKTIYNTARSVVKLVWGVVAGLLGFLRYVLGWLLTKLQQGNRAFRPPHR